jgi:CRP-like cAMP-binding protein
MGSNEEVSCSYFPGEPVFLQGDQVPEYFKVLSGRFAKVRSGNSVKAIGVKRMLAEAELIDVVSHQQLFGEIEALMGQPQPFSVFALDEATVYSIPAKDHSNMQDVFCQRPQLGVKTCVSFATFLKQFFTHFTNVAKEEVELDAFSRKAARDYLAVINELESIGGRSKYDKVIHEAKSRKAYELAKEICNCSSSSEKSTSVTCGVVRIPNQKIKLQKFSTGSLLCKKGEVGDRLFIVTDGSAEVIIGGNSKNIPINAPGSIIGEIAVFLNLGSSSPTMRRTADVVCATDVSAIVVQLDQVEDFFCRQPDLMTKMLLAMVERSDNTRKLCIAAEKRLKNVLFEKMGILLEAINDLGHSLEYQKEWQPSFERPYAFCAARSREIYNRFKLSLQTIKQRAMIKT